MKDRTDWKKILEQFNEKEYKSKWIDSHAHYNTYKYNEDRDVLLNQLTNNLDAIINCGTNTKTNQETIDLTKKHNFIYGLIGYFPCDVLELEKNTNKLELLKRQCSEDKVVGIGEIGLDYHWNSVGYNADIIKGREAVKLQKKWFIKQLKLANELKLPVCIHSRDANEDTLQILKEYKPEYGAVIHCYAYDLKTAKEYTKLGFYFGIGGTSTYKNNIELIEAIKYIPLEQIVLETDCPYLTPNPKRRDRNDSSYIKYVIDNLADIKKIDSETIIEVTNNNVKNLYKKMMYNMP